MSEAATARVDRLLTMVPWLVNRQGIDLAEAAEGLGVTQRQLEEDLSLLFLCGYGSMPDEMIDITWDDGRIYVRNADTISRPLRLAADEAVALAVGLRALAETPGIADSDLVARTLAKVERAGGAATEVANRVRARLTGADEAAHLSALREALQDGRVVHLRYVVPSRDEVTERDVDPLQLLNLQGRWYLEGWCRHATDTRLFRVDRIEELTVRQEAAAPPAGVVPRDPGQAPFTPAVDDLVVTLRLRPGAHWVAEYHPCETVTEDPGRPEDLIVTVRTADTAWLTRLVLRLGGRAVVLDPRPVAQQVAAAAGRALAAYPPASVRS